MTIFILGGKSAILKIGEANHFAWLKGELNQVCNIWIRVRNCRMKFEF
jgi:hypothetical protein